MVGLSIEIRRLDLHVLLYNRDKAGAVSIAKGVVNTRSYQLSTKVRINGSRVTTSSENLEK